MVLFINMMDFGFPKAAICVRQDTEFSMQSAMVLGRTL